LTSHSDNTLTTDSWSVSLGLDKGGYCHELFLRDKRFLALLIKGKQGKGAGSGRNNKPNLPDFYTLPFLRTSKPNNCPEENATPQASEPKSPPEISLPPTNQAQISAFEESLNLQHRTLSAVMYEQQQESHRQARGNIPLTAQANLAGNSVLTPKQQLDAYISRITGGAQVLPCHTSANLQMPFLREIGIGSFAMPEQQQGTYIHAPVKNPFSVQVNPPGVLTLQQLLERTPYHLRRPFMFPKSF
jgi:hypothetical protein